MTESKKLTSTPESVDPLDWPEGYLWVRLGPGRLTMIDGDRLHELMGGSIPETPTEELLASDPEWLRIYLAHCLGVCPIQVPAGGPLPAWDAEWVASIE